MSTEETLVEKTRRAAEHAIAFMKLRIEMHEEMVEDLRALPTAPQLELARTYAAGLRAHAAFLESLADDLTAVTNELVKDVS
jgi:hypothetical protein